MLPAQLLNWQPGISLAKEANDLLLGVALLHRSRSPCRVERTLDLPATTRQKAVAALANKNARILWAVLTREGTFEANHVPETPAPHCALSQRPASC
jgi:hypothetical protein